MRRSCGRHGVTGREREKAPSLGDDAQCLEGTWRVGGSRESSAKH